MKRLFLILLGLIFIGLDILLYLKSVEEEGIYILLFGIASAVLVPAGVSIIIYTFGEKNRKIFKQLSEVPEMSKLIERAETTEQKLDILKEEYLNLKKTIQVESKFLSLISRKEHLEKDAKRILTEYDFVELELQAFETEEKERNLSAELVSLRERIKAKQMGDIVIRVFGIQYVVRKKELLAIPTFGFLFFIGLKILEELSQNTSPFKKGLI